MAGESSRERTIRKKLLEAARAGTTPTQSAEAAIWAAVVISMGMGAVPFGIDIAWNLAVFGVLIAVLGELYGYTYSKRQASALLRQMIKQLRFSYGAYTVMLKVAFESLKVGGAITGGTATAAGLAFDAVWNGALTYAIGYTTLKYFEQNRELSAEETRAEFHARLAEGRARVTAVVREQAAAKSGQLRAKVDDGRKRVAARSAIEQQRLKSFGAGIKRASEGIRDAAPARLATLKAKVVPGR